MGVSLRAVVELRAVAAYGGQPLPAGGLRSAEARGHWVPTLHTCVRLEQTEQILVRNQLI